jgi:hypothetical protein
MAGICRLAIALASLAITCHSLLIQLCALKTPITLFSSFFPGLLGCDLTFCLPGQIDF